MPDLSAEAWALTHFDPIDRERMQDPYPAYKALRDQCPVAHSDVHEKDGFWILSRYEDVLAAAQDPVRFASGPSISIPALGSPLPLLPVEANPPRHAGLRKLVAKALSPASVLTYEDRIRAHVIELIAKLAARGECDLVPEFAFPVPARMMFHPPLLGHPIPIAEDDWIATFQRWVHDLKTNPAKSAEAGRMILSYLERLLADREAHPQDDIPSGLFAEVRAGGDLNRSEALGILFVLFMGGIETPANAIGLLLLHLARHPESREWLRANPDKIPGAVEELLRYYGPSQGVRRTLTEDVLLHGQTLKKGDPVWLLLNGADRDERVFDCAEDIQFERRPNRHLGFGAGPHRCIGSHLSRLLLRIITQEIVTRAPDFRVRDGAELRWGMGVSRSLETLPVVFDR
jgi:hypothetical protein